MVWHYNTICRQNINIEKFFVYVSERSERAYKICIFTFKNCYFFQYFVGTSETLSVQMTYLSAYNVPTDFQMYQQNSEKAVEGNCPPPPFGYASALPYVLSLV